MSTGTEFAKMVRTNARINSRTRDNRDHGGIKAGILEATQNALSYPGYYSEARTSLYRAAFPAVCAYIKHIDGYRANPVLVTQLHSLSPWAFAGFLGEMIDAGITNNGEAERYFADMARCAA